MGLGLDCLGKGLVNLMGLIRDDRRGGALPQPAHRRGGRHAAVRACSGDGLTNQNPIQSHAFPLFQSRRYKLEEAMEAGVNWDVDKPRDQWLFDYPAQVK